MNIERYFIRAGVSAVPSVMIKPDKSRGAAVVVHGYGGCKEELLGLAWRVAETGITACAIDLRGHGEHALPFDEDVLADVQAAVEFCRAFGKVVAIGHSSGGRLSLISAADCAIGISPALETTYSPQTEEIIKGFRGYRVRESYAGVNFVTLKKLPTWKATVERPTGIIFGSRDVPEIVRLSVELKSQGQEVIEIKNALHNDIFTLEKTFEAVKMLLGKWYG